MASLERWKKAGLFVPYFGKKWDPQADPVALAAVQEWIEHLEEHITSDGLGLLFFGDPGRGKTLLAHIAADAALDFGERLRPLPRRDVLLALTVQGYIELFHRQMSALDVSKHTGSTQAADEYMRMTETIDAIQTRIKVLLIDDLGKEHSTNSGFAENQIERLIRARGNRGLPTLITTNLGSEQLSSRYGPSFASYVLQVCSVVSVRGGDYRRLKLVSKGAK